MQTKAKTVIGAAAVIDQQDCHVVDEWQGVAFRFLIHNKSLESFKYSLDLLGIFPFNSV